MLRDVYGPEFEQQLRHPLAWVLEQDSVVALTGSVDGVSLGAILLHRHDGRVCLNALAVLPVARRRGVARALIKAAIDHAQAEGMRRLVAAVEPDGVWIRERYLALGFRAVSDDLYLGHVLLAREV